MSESWQRGEIVFTESNGWACVWRGDKLIEMTSDLTYAIAVFVRQCKRRYGPDE